MGGGFRACVQFSCTHVGEIDTALGHGVSGGEDSAGGRLSLDAARHAAGGDAHHLVVGRRFGDIEAEDTARPLAVCLDRAVECTVFNGGVAVGQCGDTARILVSVDFGRHDMEIAHRGAVAEVADEADGVGRRRCGVGIAQQRAVGAKFGAVYRYVAHGVSAAVDMSAEVILLYRAVFGGVDGRRYAREAAAGHVEVGGDAEVCVGVVLGIVVARCDRGQCHQVGRSGYQIRVGLSAGTGIQHGLLGEHISLDEIAACERGQRRAVFARRVACIYGSTAVADFKPCTVGH